MTSYYKYLPNKTIKQSKLGLRQQQIRRYFFALLLLLTIIVLSLYEFYFAIVENAKHGSRETTVMERVMCQVFMLSICPSKNATDPAVIELRRKVDEINRAQYIRNFEGLEITDQTVILITQVHNRAAYLAAFIKSLPYVKDINSSILIFSHDYYDEEINDMIQAIDFAPVLQIFYPYSIQLYPDEFPGTSPEDCKWDMNVDEAKRQNCRGTADAYGHYREGNTTQLKHHWWWKINTVFDELAITRGFNGFVMFLEEDFYLSPDILYLLHAMVDFAAKECPECNCFSLGNHNDPRNFNENLNIVDIKEWNNLGYAFNRTLWRMFTECANVFCTFDDYNWDYSLTKMAQDCFSPSLKTMVPRSSRVLHTGRCGFHSKAASCDLNESLKFAQDNLSPDNTRLFPERLELQLVKLNEPRIKKGWGGWADPRDIQLCLNMSSQP